MKHLKEEVRRETRSRIGRKMALPAGGLLWWSEVCNLKWDFLRVSVSCLEFWFLEPQTLNPSNPKTLRKRLRFEDHVVQGHTQVQQGRDMHLVGMRT
jgi:hypothetical protein